MSVSLASRAQSSFGKPLFGSEQLTLDGTDALSIANHNARAAQAMTLAAPQGMRLELFDRKTGEWTALAEKDGAFSFELAAAGGELLRVRGGKLP